MTNKVKRLDKCNERERREGPHVTAMPRYFGRGANIRIVAPDGSVTQTNPAAYRKMPKPARESLCAAILSAC